MEDRRQKGVTHMSLLIHDHAQQVLQAGLRKAEEIGSPSSIAVLDEARELKAFARLDEALLASTDISISKAFTARSLAMNTGDLMPLVQPGGPFYGVERTQVRPLVPFAGGRPLMIGEAIAGAVGVAGGTPEQDDEIAAAAVEALSEV